MDVSCRVHTLAQRRANVQAQQAEDIVSFSRTHDGTCAPPSPYFISYTPNLDTFPPTPPAPRKLYSPQTSLDPQGGEFAKVASRSARCSPSADNVAGIITALLPPPR
ncbi:hypothetical protein EW146_g7183 [Bondarzewia mesenterica]|uniref:Uncharacterized protein n=1 Tax=Bondarzewia mesenterica TaxID=1095465 RepID=A0A4S4LLG6_9AGAM|nr:hypothetical protein EW146_g7183 [Bondarzewia mesenterica]